jgi:hypothetical protein
MSDWTTAPLPDIKGLSCEELVCGQCRYSGRIVDPANSVHLRLGSQWLDLHLRPDAISWRWADAPREDSRTGDAVQLRLLDLGRQLDLVPAPIRHVFAECPATGPCVTMVFAGTTLSLRWQSDPKGQLRGWTVVDVDGKPCLQPDPEPVQPQSKVSDALLGAWFGVNRFLVRLSTPGESAYSAFVLERSKAGEQYIDIELFAQDARITGQLMVVGNKLLRKGLSDIGGPAIDLLDWIALHLQLVLKLLAYGTGKAPAAIDCSCPVAHHECDETIRNNTASAKGELRPPWSVVGEVKSEAADRIHFDLILSADDGAFGVQAAGQWQCVDPVPCRPDSFSLQGWEVFSLGLVRQATRSGEAVSPGASPLAEVYPTLGELRAAEA